jgi:predicted signal transduction protein with EAL and GGDEF domain
MGCSTAIRPRCSNASRGSPRVAPTHRPRSSRSSPTSASAIDSSPRVWEAAQLEALADVAVLVGNKLERRELMRRLANDARTDALTGIANRRAWDEELAAELRRAQ